MSAFARATAVESLGDGTWRATCDGGRSLSTVTARLSQADALCVLAVAAFGIELNGAVDYAAQAPPAPRPERVDRLAPVAEVPITTHFVMRPTIGAPLYAGAEDSVTGGWLRFADPQALDAPALAMYADAWWPSPLPRLTRPVAAPTIDLTVHFRAPAVAAAIDEEPVLAVFRSSTAAGGFFEEDGQLWSRDGVLLAHSRQLALLLDGGR